MMKIVDLTSSEILSSQQACEEWGIDSSTLRKRAHDFPAGTIRKFGTTYAVTRAGMCAVFGRKRVILTQKKGETAERYESRD
ncbi:helix-turn-helix domain-containing protein [Bacillus haynesii]|uniref:helix-turn-helix domain-containing protein n=1 Tax=Bacillus haynesii TaxID=1925021 RepID=UPI002280263A|nr:helix-turn-helix domain-containing protein [Bacillus haynesii]MCY8643328.1 helix-turn-helix domain-containing protein [Bacillus haynesii]